MVVNVQAKTYADYRNATKNGNEVSAEQIFKVQRAKQIAIATVCAVAFAVFAAIAALSFVALATVISGAVIFALPAFVPLALGMIATITALGLAALAIKKSIDAHRNLPPKETIEDEAKAKEAEVKKSADKAQEAANLLNTDKAKAAAARAKEHATTAASALKQIETFRAKEKAALDAGDKVKANTWASKAKEQLEKIRKSAVEAEDAADEAETP